VDLISLFFIAGQAINAIIGSQSQILGTVSSFYFYTYEASNQFAIPDGGRDMYDSGNTVTNKHI